MARLEAVRASGMKAAAGRHVREVGRVAGHRFGPLGAVQAGETGEQELGVRVLRLDEHPLRRAELQVLAGVGHGDLVAEVARQPDIVGDEDHRDAGVLLQVLEQVHDLGLDADVQGAGRLVEDEQIGIEDEGRGDDDALLLAAAELVRVAIEDAARTARPVRAALRPSCRRPFSPSGCRAGAVPQPGRRL